MLVGRVLYPLSWVVHFKRQLFFLFLGGVGDAERAGKKLTYRTDFVQNGRS